jgi:hypothetical protein
MRKISFYKIAIGLLLTGLLSACFGGGSGSSVSTSGGSTTPVTGNAGPLEGCWRSSALVTTWCFTGTTGLITTDSTNGVPGQQITGLVQMTFTSTSMTYYINRAAATANGVYLYDNAINPPTGPNVQPYILDSTGTSFTAGNGTYTKIGTTTTTTPIPTPTPAPTTGQIAVYTTRATTQTGSTTVTIDNVTAGSLTTYFTSAPTCGASGTVTKTLSVGSHTLSAADGTLTWGPTTFSITAGGCVTFALN